MILSGIVKDLAEISSKFYIDNSLLNVPSITDVSGSELTAEAAQRAALNTSGDGMAQVASFAKSLTK